MFDADASNNVDADASKAAVTPTKASAVGINTNAPAGELNSARCATPDIELNIINERISPA